MAAPATVNGNFLANALALRFKTFKKPTDQEAADTNRDQDGSEDEFSDPPKLK